MQKIDIYVAKRFFFFFFLATLAALAIYLVVDPIENLDNFLDRGVSKQEIFRYYVLYVPYIIYLTFPVAILLATMFCIGGLTSSNELLAMTASGIPLTRHLVWLLVIGAVLSGTTLWFGETLVPSANRERMEIWRQQVKNRQDWRLTEQGRIYLQDGPNKILHLDLYQPKSQTGYGIDYYFYKDNRIIRRYTAQQMTWNGDQWVLHDVVIRDFLDENEKIIRESRFKIGLAVEPDDMVELKIEPEEMGMADLQRFVDRMRSTGGNPTRWIVDIHSKVALPLAGVIIVLFGVPVSAVRRRSGMVFGITISLLIAFIYFGLMQIGKVLGYKEILPPWLAAWFGNIIFLFLGSFLFSRAPK
ncbi:LPS export ABC transporter permease LptG [bacterium]|nr:LPS export ABC transporter permease LptG [bacterium]